MAELQPANLADLLPYLAIRTRTRDESVRESVRPWLCSPEVFKKDVNEYQVCSIQYEALRQLMNNLIDRSANASTFTRALD